MQFSAPVSKISDICIFRLVHQGDFATTRGNKIYLPLVAKFTTSMSIKTVLQNPVIPKTIHIDIEPSDHFFTLKV